MKNAGQAGDRPLPLPDLPLSALDLQPDQPLVEPLSVVSVGGVEDSHPAGYSVLPLHVLLPPPDPVVLPDVLAVRPLLPGLPLLGEGDDPLVSPPLPTDQPTVEAEAPPLPPTPPLPPGPVNCPCHVHLRCH